MCMEDIYISHSLTKSRINLSINAAAGVQPLVSADALRYALLITTDAAGVVWIDSDPGVAIGTGIPIKVTDQPLQLSAAEFGDFVRCGIWAVTALAGLVNISVLQSSFIPERLQDAKSMYERLLSQALDLSNV